MHHNNARKDKRLAMGKQAEQVAQQNRGALQRLLHCINEQL